MATLLALDHPDVQKVRQVFLRLPWAALRSYQPITASDYDQIKRALDWYEELVISCGWAVLLQDEASLRYYLCFKRKLYSDFGEKVTWPVVLFLYLAIRHGYDESCEVILREGRREVTHEISHTTLHQEFLYHGLAPKLVDPEGLGINSDHLFSAILRFGYTDVDDGDTLILTIMHGSVQRVRALLRAGASKSKPVSCHSVPYSRNVKLKTETRKFDVEKEDTPLKFATRNREFFPENYQELQRFELTLEDMCLIFVRRRLGKLTKEKARQLQLPQTLEKDLLFEKLRVKR